MTLPDRQVATNVGAPFAGAKFYYSSTGDDMDNADVQVGHAAGRRQRL